MTGLSLGVQPLVAYLYGGRRYRRQNVIGNMGYYTAFGLGIVMTGVSVAGHNVFPGWFNLHGEAAALAAHGLIISSTAFVLLGVVRVAGYYYQATGKIIDSSLLIYGDAFVAPAVMSVYAAFVVRHGRRLAGDAGITGFAVLVCLLFVVLAKGQTATAAAFFRQRFLIASCRPKTRPVAKEMTEIKTVYVIEKFSGIIN